ncbi:MAG: IS1 family transposase, partial [Pyrinomonadaceae bacterium]
MKCPKCKSERIVKDGKAKGKQRHLCKVCGYRHTVEYKGKPPEIKRLALQMYLEGFGFRSIGRILKVSNVAVMKWIKSFGEQVEKIRKEDAAKIIEMDEMHTYIQSKKNYCWIWIAVDRLGKRYIHFVLGTRGTETGIKLWETIKDRSGQSTIMTDYWKAYEEFLSAERYICSKAETYTVESYNSILRHFLARLRRKEKCYSKSQQMLHYSLLPLMAKRNNELSIIELSII